MTLALHFDRAGSRHSSQPVRAAPVHPRPLAHTSSSHPAQDSSGTVHSETTPPPFPTCTQASHPTNTAPVYCTQGFAPTPCLLSFKGSPGMVCPRPPSLLQPSCQGSSGTLHPGTTPDKAHPRSPSPCPLKIQLFHQGGPSVVHSGILWPVLPVPATTTIPRQP